MYEHPFWTGPAELTKQGGWQNRSQFVGRCHCVDGGGTVMTPIGRASSSGSRRLRVLPQSILLTIWASDSAAWAGPVDSTTAPTSAEYDWIRVYCYVGP
jgi:hypothetical protein